MVAGLQKRVLSLIDSMNNSGEQVGIPIELANMFEDYWLIDEEIVKLLKDCGCDDDVIVEVIEYMNK